MTSMAISAKARVLHRSNNTINPLKLLHGVIGDQITVGGLNLDGVSNPSDLTLQSISHPRVSRYLNVPPRLLSLLGLCALVLQENGTLSFNHSFATPGCVGRSEDDVNLY